MDSTVLYISLNYPLCFSHCSSVCLCKCLCTYSTLTCVYMSVCCGAEELTSGSCSWFHFGLSLGMVTSPSASRTTSIRTEQNVSNIYVGQYISVGQYKVCVLRKVLYTTFEILFNLCRTNHLCMTTHIALPVTS